VHVRIRIEPSGASRKAASTLARSTPSNSVPRIVRTGLEQPSHVGASCPRTCQTLETSPMADRGANAEEAGTMPAFSAYCYPLPRCNYHCLDKTCPRTIARLLIRMRASFTHMITSQLAAKRKSIKIVAISILLIAGLAIAAILALTTWLLRQLQLASARISTINVTSALADQASSDLKMVDTVLVAMVDRVETNGLSASDKDAFRVLMARHLAELPALQGLSIYDEAGRWIVKSADLSYDSRNNSDREHFRFHQASTDRGVYIGAPIIGRTSGACVIPVSRRLRDADGRFAGVVLATIKINFSRKIYERIDLRRDGRIILALDSGV